MDLMDCLWLTEFKMEFHLSEMLFCFLIVADLKTNEIFIY